MSTIIYKVEKQVAFISLYRPEVFNSFNREMALELQQTLDRCGKDENIRAIYFTGDGKAFCAGQDLGEAVADNGLDIATIVKEHYNPVILKLRRLEKPVIAAVNGVAAGAGANIALACDIVVAKESAAFIQAFSKIGLIPDSGGTFMLPRLIGFQRAMALMMTAEKIMAVDAEKMGMIYKTYPDDSFEEESKKLAFQIAGMPTKALVLTKMAMNESLSHNLDEQLEVEATLQAQSAATADFKEGIRAFMEKRVPDFKGQ